MPQDGYPTDIGVGRTRTATASPDPALGYRVSRFAIGWGCRPRGVIGSVIEREYHPGIEAEGLPAPPATTITMSFGVSAICTIRRPFTSSIPLARRYYAQHVGVASTDLLERDAGVLASVWGTRSLSKAWRGADVARDMMLAMPRSDATMTPTFTAGTRAATATDS